MLSVTILRLSEFSSSLLPSTALPNSFTFVLFLSYPKGCIGASLYLTEIGSQTSVGREGETQCSVWSSSLSVLHVLFSRSPLARPLRTKPTRASAS